LQAQLVARSGTIESGLFCATCWSNMTRLLKTPIAGRNAAPVASSCSDRLAGLSKNEILRMPPAFWAQAMLEQQRAINSPPTIPNARGCPVIGLSLSLLFRLAES